MVQASPRKPPRSPHFRPRRFVAAPGLLTRRACSLGQPPLPPALAAPLRAARLSSTPLHPSFVVDAPPQAPESRNLAQQAKALHLGQLVVLPYRRGARSPALPRQLQDSQPHQ